MAQALPDVWGDICLCHVDRCEVFDKYVAREWQGTSAVKVREGYDQLQRTCLFGAVRVVRGDKDALVRAALFQRAQTPQGREAIFALYVL